MRQIFLALFIVFAVGCNYFISTDQIAKDTKVQIQDEFNSNPDFKPYRLKVKDLTVVKQSNNEYKGLAEIGYQGKTYRVSVDIVIDGKRYMWQIPAENFNFIRQAEIKKYQKELEETIQTMSEQIESQSTYIPEQVDYSYEVVDAQTEAEEAARAAQEAAEYAVAEASDDYS